MKIPINKQVQYKTEKIKRYFLSKIKTCFIKYL